MHPIIFALNYCAIYLVVRRGLQVPPSEVDRLLAAMRDLLLGRERVERRFRELD
jgi:hypothetical protein